MNKQLAITGLIVLLVLAVFIANKMLRPVQQEYVTKDTKPTLIPSAFDYITDDQVKKHFLAMTTLLEYRAVNATTSAGTKVMTEFMYTDTGYIYRTIETKENETLSDVIVEGNTVYIKDKTDTCWWKGSLDPVVPSGVVTDTDAVKITTPKDISQEYTNKEQVIFEDMGEEQCGERLCFKYKETYLNSTGTERVFWFDSEQYLLRKEEVGTGDIISTTEYSYDNIEITVPVKTKPLREGTEVYEYL